MSININYCNSDCFRLFVNEILRLEDKNLMAELKNSNELIIREKTRWDKIQSFFRIKLKSCRRDTINRALNKFFTNKKF